LSAKGYFEKLQTPNKGWAPKAAKKSSSEEAAERFSRVRGSSTLAASKG
jgi:hypothetical protein